MALVFLLDIHPELHHNILLLVAVVKEGYSLHVSDTPSASSIPYAKTVTIDYDEAGNPSKEKI